MGYSDLGSGALPNVDITVQSMQREAECLHQQIVVCCYSDKSPKNDVTATEDVPLSLELTTKLRDSIGKKQKNKNNEKHYLCIVI